MRTGIALSVIRTEVLIEAGFGTAVGSAAFSQDRITQMINRTERLMYEMDDWGNLSFEQTITAQKNQQMQLMPSNLEFGGIKTAHVEYGKEWLPLTYGITPEDRSIYDTTQRSSPGMKWEYIPFNDARHSSNELEQYELWPISSVDQLIFFTGQKILGTMNDENDTCTLDADVIVLRVAAEILGRDKKEDASLKLTMATSLTVALTKKLGSGLAPPINLGGHSAATMRPGIDYIAPGSS